MTIIPNKPTSSFVNAFVARYGKFPSGPTIISITGGYRNGVIARNTDALYRIRVLGALLLCIICAIVGVSIVFQWSIYWKTLSGVSLLDLTRRYTTLFRVLHDSHVVEIDPTGISVVIATQLTEALLESANFVDRNDLDRLKKASNMPENTGFTVLSVGTTTTQTIYKKKYTSLVTEFSIGTDSQNTIEMRKLLNSQPSGPNNVTVFVNAVGYGLDKNAGLVFANNSTGENTISEHIVDRVIGGTGNNENAKQFINKLLSLYIEMGCTFTLAIAPRGDPTMPQGGSHSMQRILNAFRDTGLLYTVLEVSGKQTKLFEPPTDEPDTLRSMTPEDFCKKIKETKVVDTGGHSYGSMSLFGSIPME